MSKRADVRACRRSVGGGRGPRNRVPRGARGVTRPRHGPGRRRRPRQGGHGRWRVGANIRATPRPRARWGEAGHVLRCLWRRCCRPTGRSPNHALKSPARSLAARRPGAAPRDSLFRRRPHRRFRAEFAPRVATKNGSAGAPAIRVSRPARAVALWCARCAAMARRIARREALVAGRIALAHPRRRGL